MKRFVLLLVVFGAIGLALSSVARPSFERLRRMYALATDEAPAHLPNPVASARPPRIVNSWGNARAGGRRHEGIDIFAPAGTPIVSTTYGIVTRVGTNNLGGRIVMVLGPGLESHYYAHLDRYGEFRVGDLVEAGDVIGYVGDSGNARGGPPHLHYGIYRSGAENPYPRLIKGGAALDARRNPAASDHGSLPRSPAP